MARHADIGIEIQDCVAVNREPAHAVLIWLAGCSEAGIAEKDVEILVGDGFAILTVHETDRNGDILCRKHGTPERQKQTVGHRFHRFSTSMCALAHALYAA